MRFLRPLPLAPGYMDRLAEVLLPGEAAFEEVQTFNEPVGKRRIAQRIVDMPPLPALLHQMVCAQDCQMLRNRRVADAEQPLQSVDVHFPLVQFDENAQPVRMGNGAQ